MSSAYGCADGNHQLRAVGIDLVGSSPKVVGLARAVGVAW
jgi:hypothetical protein